MSWFLKPFSLVDERFLLKEEEESSGTKTKVEGKNAAKDGITGGHKRHHGREGNICTIEDKKQEGIAIEFDHIIYMKNVTFYVRSWYGGISILTDTWYF